jgi:hypothetical protein
LSLLDDNEDTIRKNTETSIDSSKEGGLEVNTEKTKYMLLAGSKFEGKCCSEFSTYFREHMAFRNADESLVCSDKA